MYVGINNTTGVNEMLCMLESMIVNTTTIVNITTGVNEMLCMLESMIVNTTNGVNEMLCMFNQ